MLVKKLARLAEIHDAELRDIMAATKMTIYIIPESHPAVDAIKDKHQACGLDRRNKNKKRDRPRKTS